ncbi:hypothetical protein RJ640_005176 [Escallonia rubra]|uniref:CRAL-TRIO domain-containing protein n=1 Tax=Escallonia rubra TaxID=112253 RepID=A0AA88UU19_9ASTE|nr:hypothetical protein RJ640_005176 [Escallonia rubra]
MALRLHQPLVYPFSVPKWPRNSGKIRSLSARNCASLHTNDSRKIVVEVKEKLEKDHYDLPVGSNGRDDEDMILWFLKDRKFCVEDAVSKLTKAIKWRQEFGVSQLSEESVKNAAETGKAYMHEFLDVNDRPVLIVEASKHFPGDPSEDEKLCVFLIERALRELPDGKEEILVIMDLRGFGTKNADLKFLTFLVMVYGLSADNHLNLNVDFLKKMKQVVHEIT